MQNKNKLFGLLLAALAICVVPYTSYAEDDDYELEEEISFVDSGEEFDERDASDTLSASAVANYNVDGSVFQQITDLEQEKVLMELEKERAQLDLDLERLLD